MCVKARPECPGEAKREGSGAAGEEDRHAGAARQDHEEGAANLNASPPSTKERRMSASEKPPIRVITAADTVWGEALGHLRARLTGD